MDYTFSDTENDDLIDRGFEVEQIHYLESLEIEPRELYSDICKTMDDFGDTPEQIIESYQEAQNNPPIEAQNNFPDQGGKRRRRRRKTRRRNQSKSRRKTKRRKQSKSRSRTMR